MTPQIILVISSEQGRFERAVESARFTVGSGTDNDLVIDDASVARRHALIETFDGRVHLSDCGAETGTLVNGKLINGSVVLRENDEITIGTACRIRVQISQGHPEQNAAAVKPDASRTVLRPLSPAMTPRFSTPVIAFAAVALILLMAVPFAVLSNKEGEKRESRAARSSNPQNDEGDHSTSVPRQSLDDRDSHSDNEPASNTITVEQVEAAAAQFLRRISSDDRPYVFPPYAVKGLEDIKRKVEQFRASPALAGALNSISAADPTIAAEARREGIEPGLIIFTAMAETGGERLASDQVAITHRVLPEMMALKKTLGTESADKSLILVAAYRMGGGSKKSHPLLQTMRRVVKNPLTDRNVWFLREHGGLDDSAYNFVVSFLALGVIAESPRRFGIAAAPVAY